MLDCFADSGAIAGAVPVTPLTEAALPDWLASRTPDIKSWVGAVGFGCEPGAICLLPGAGGRLAGVLLGIGEDGAMWDYAGLPSDLPPGVYALDGELPVPAMARAALAWALGGYHFARYSSDKTGAAGNAVLALPETCDRAAVESAAEATFLVRDLINTPAEDMGPEQLAAAAADLAGEFGAEFSQITGDALLDENYPAIHAVGRASDRAPRLIDIRWGAADAPRVTLVGKGVCFDSGGLDLKSADGMKLMKKDMGGGAHALGLARMIMSAALPVRLRCLIPAVENAVSGNALRPLDVVATRKGITVEIGNTDAEGRVILADALAEGARENPRLLIDFATLTGAARIALGADLPALFCNDDDFAAAIDAAAAGAADPLWRLPLWPGYRKDIDSKVADITNAPEGRFGGAITAALFLQEFVGGAASWAHLDVMAWNKSARAGRPEGGEAMAMRAMFAAISAQFPK